MGLAASFSPLIAGAVRSAAAPGPPAGPAAPMPAIATLAASLAALWSGTTPPRRAVIANAAPDARTVAVIVAPAVRFSEPSVQTTLAPVVHVPSVEVAVVAVTPAGSSSVSVSPGALSRPAFWIVAMSVTSSPAAALVFDACSVTERSAPYSTAPKSQAGPAGRALPRWSVVSSPQPVAPLRAGESAAGSSVSVGPPLSASVVSLTGVLRTLAAPRHSALSERLGAGVGDGARCAGSSSGSTCRRCRRR